VHGVEHTGFDGVEHLESPNDRAGGQTFDQQFTLGHRSDLLAEILELRVTDRPGVQAVCIFILMGAAAERRITPGNPITPAAAPVATAGVFKKLRRDPFSPVIFSSFVFLRIDIPPSSFFGLGLFFEPTLPIEHDKKTVQ